MRLEPGDDERWCGLTGPPEVLTVVGGSSPFVLRLVAAIAAEPPWTEGVLRLQGRDGATLAAVGRCASNLLAGSGWQVECATDLRAVLDGADVVLHQNRYGGLGARQLDEHVATALGLPPDETLGPAGLLAALRTMHAQRPYAEALRRHAPSAAVLTMTNPLGVSVAGLAAGDVGVLGLCEVPETTRRAVAAALGLGAEELDGDYSGLNHRGHWHRMRTAGGEVGQRLVDVLERRPDHLPWTDANEVRVLRAVPDKYAVLLSGGGVMGPGRAEALEALRREVVAEAVASPAVLPPSLAGREMPWYDLVVVPALRALAGDPCRLVVTRAVPGAPAVERQVVLHGAVVRRVGQQPPPLPVRERLERFEEHERLVLAAAEHPTQLSVRSALAADPAVPARLAGPASRAVVAAFEKWKAG